MLPGPSVVEYWLWTFGGSNFPYLGEKPQHPPPIDILSSLCSCDIILSSSFLQCHRYSFFLSPLLAPPFLFNLNCWDQEYNKNEHLIWATLLYNFPNFLIYVAKANNVPSSCYCLYSTEEESETQSSTTHPPWVSRLLMDRARQSSTTPSAHDHFSISVILRGAILPLRGQLEISGNMLVVTAREYYWHIVYRNLLNILQCTGWVWRENNVLSFPF